MQLEKILGMVDHTLLAQGSTWEDIRQICDEGMRFHTASVCIPPYYVKKAREYMGPEMPITTVIGFPNGNMTTATKVFETEDQKIRMCEIVTRSNADYIKTSTGFSAGGATFEDVALFAKHVGPRVKIKASGGISSIEDAEKFIELGASRLGTSRLVKIAASRLSQEGASLSARYPLSTRTVFHG